MNNAVSSSKHGLITLLIEDDDADAHLMTEAFNSGKLNHNRLVRVKSGDEALDYLYQREAYAESERPDLILLDLNMPKMDGREFLQILKNDTAISSIPLVVLTQSSRDEDIRNSYSNRANCFITKPVDFDEFVKVIRSIERFWFSVVKRP